MTIRTAAFFLAIMVWSTASMAADKVGYVDLAQVWSKWPAAAKHRTSIETMTRNKETALKRKKEELQKDIAQYQADGEAGRLTQETAGSRGAQLQQRTLELQLEATAAEKDLEKADFEGRDRLQIELRKIIGDAARTGGYSRILTSESLLYTADDTNLTNQILLKLGQ